MFLGASATIPVDLKDQTDSKSLYSETNSDVKVYNIVDQFIEIN